MLLKAVFSPLPLYIAFAGNTLMLSGAALFYHFESPTNAQVTDYFDAVWWAMNTVSTVGYGDVVPLTTAGRLVGMGLIVSGVLFFVSFSASIAARLMALAAQDFERTEEKILRELKELRQLIEKLGS
ncbi:MAG: potassium channel family protein [Bdellovibrionales bacterium]